MFSWDMVLTSLIVTAAAYYVAQSIYRTIKSAASGEGCSGGCSSCSHCGIGHESIGDKMAQAIELSKQQKS